nr:MAG TPA: hypothetical protein [Caudoviricetes sp.]
MTSKGVVRHSMASKSKKKINLTFNGGQKT